MRIRTILITGLLLGLLNGGALAERTPVGAFEIKLFFNGRTADCIKTKDDSTCDTYFGEDGRVQRYTHDDGKLREGRWWIDDQEQLVVQWDGRKRELHFQIFDRGDGTWELVKRGKVVSIVAGSQPGNTLPGK